MLANNLKDILRYYVFVYGNPIKVRALASLYKKHIEIQK